MDAVHSTPLTFMEFYSDPGQDPSGTDEDKEATWVVAVYLSWRATGDAPDVDEVLEDIMVYFTSPIGGVGFFFQFTRSIMSTLQVAHGFQSFPGLPGRTDRERRQVFCFVGDVMGVDVTTVAFDEDQVDNTVPGLNAPSTIEAVLQRLA
jgi:hypothetical protein